MKSKRYTFRVNEKILERMRETAKRLNVHLPDLIVISVLHAGNEAQSFHAYAELAAEVMENEHWNLS